MNALDILFNTDRFNLSKVGKHFINPCCFGEDLASWLRQKLASENVQSSQPYQEDWGWELPVLHGRDAYYLCMSGNAQESKTNKDDGEWRIIVVKRRSLWQRLKGSGEIATNDALVQMVERILSTEPGIRAVRVATSD
jgi:hypothetical protein